MTPLAARDRVRRVSVGVRPCGTRGGHGHSHSQSEYNVAEPLRLHRDEHRKRVYLCHAQHREVQPAFKPVKPGPDRPKKKTGAVIE